MPSVRQDAWTKDEDLFLAEVVLRHIREGSTQLKAFEEVGKALSRTPAACGFRWNSTVRKQYKAAIELAKRQRKELKKKQQTLSKEDKSEATIHLTMADVIAFLQEYHLREQSQGTISASEKEELAKRVAELEKENESLKQKYQRLQEEYIGLLAIMEKARKLTEQSGGREKRTETQENEEGT